MQFSLKPYHKNSYPLQGTLVRGSSAKAWAMEVQLMGLSLSEVTVFALPDLQANSVWGCLIIPHMVSKDRNIGKNNRCQLVNDKLFIPENTVINPHLADEEISQLFPKHQYICHPHFGLVELAEAFDWAAVLSLPPSTNALLREPAKSVFIPTKVNGFLVNPVPEEDVFKNLEEKIFPKKEKLEDKPLNLLEKAKLFGLRALMKKGAAQQGGTPTRPVGAETEIPSWLEKLMTMGIFKKKPKWLDKLEEDLEDLENRNKKEVDKLLDLFKNNPKEALKYAIPIDDSGAGRGGDKGSFKMSRLWANFDLFGNNSRASGGPGSVIGSDHFARLQTQYRLTAEELVKNGEYMEAAFIYLKLLRSPFLAAQALENGKRYQEAATLYLRQGNMQLRAAECYEKGSMYPQAIELYKEIPGHEEKIGDIYLTINNKEEAHNYYHKAVDKHLHNVQHIKASVVYRNKLDNMPEAQKVLMEGWRHGGDGHNCLVNYFDNIEDKKALAHEIDAVYERETNDKNKKVFLQVLKHEHGKGKELEPVTKQIAYEIISEQAKTDPSIVSELRAFNKEDAILPKDLIYYKRGK